MVGSRKTLSKSDVIEALGYTPGADAYNLATQQGFEGSLNDWLASLVGAAGASAYQLAVGQGFVGSVDEWLSTLIGADGASAYQLAVGQGFGGNLAAWLASLVGPAGPQGDLTPQAQALADQMQALVAGSQDSATLAANAAANLGAQSSRAGELVTRALSGAIDIVSNDPAFTSLIQNTQGYGTFTKAWDCAVGGQVAPGVPLDGFVHPLKLPAGVDQLRASLWEIDTASADMSIPSAGNNNYTLVGAVVTVTPEEAGIETNTHDAWPAYFFVTPDSPEQPWVSKDGKSYVSVVDAYTAGVWTPIGHGQVNDVTVMSARVRGRLRHGENTADLNLGSPARLSGNLISRSLHDTTSHTGAALDRASALSDASSGDDWTAYHAIEATDAFLPSGNYIRWTAACDQDIADGKPIEGGGAALIGSAGLDRVTCQIWRRLKSRDATAGPGRGVGDHQAVTEISMTAADLALPMAKPAKVSWFPLQTIIDQDPRFIYWPEFRGWDSDDNPVSIGIGLIEEPGASQNHKGWYYNTASNSWTGVTGDARIAVWLGVRTPIRAADLQGQIADQAQELGDHDARLDAVEATFTPVSVDRVVINASNAFHAGLGDQGWTATVKLGVDMQLGQSFQRMQIPNQELIEGSAGIMVYLYDRPFAAAENANPGTAGDILNDNYPLFVSAADLGVTPGAGLATGTIAFPQRYSPRAGYHLQWYWYAVDGDGNRLASGQGYVSDGAAGVGQRGRYIATNGFFGPVGGGLRLSYKLQSDALQSTSSAIEFTTRTQVLDASATAAGLSVQVSVTTTLQGAEATFSDTITLPSTSSGNAVEEPVTLAYGAGQTGMVYMSALAHANISLTAVTDTSRRPITDYIANLAHGGIAKATAGVSIDALVSYGWSGTAYAVIYLDLVTGEIGYVLGPERVRDAVELMPDLGQAGRKALFTARTTATGVILTPVWNADGLTSRNISVEQMRDRQAQREAVPLTRAALQQGRKTCFIVDSDSITALQAGAPTVWVNGPNRDRARSPGGYLVTNFLGRDLYDGSGDYPALPLIDTGDGAGPNHTQFGYMWEMIRILRARYASEIIYDNMGIAGSTDGTGTNNALDDARFQAYKDQIALRVGQGYAVNAVLGFGMNNLLAMDTLADMMVLKAAAHAQGAEVTIVGTWHPNSNFMSDLTPWRTTQRILSAIAAYADPDTGQTAAYINTVALTDLGTNVTGIPAIDFCSCNGLNHPGMREHPILGRAVAQPFLT